MHLMLLMRQWFVEHLLARSLRRKWLELLSSPLSALTLQQDRRESAGIHRDACYFRCFDTKPKPKLGAVCEQAFSETCVCERRAGSVAACF